MQAISWKKSNFHWRLLKEVFPNKLEDQDAMRLLAILYSCQIQLARPILEGHPDLTLLEPISTSHAAEAIASLWKGNPDSRNRASYWYGLWNGSWSGYARLETVSEDDATRSRELKQTLEQHPFVQQIIPADCNPFEADE